MAETPKNKAELIAWLDKNFGNGKGYPVAMSWRDILVQIEALGFLRDKPNG